MNIVKKEFIDLNPNHMTLLELILASIVLTPLISAIAVFAF